MSAVQNLAIPPHSLEAERSVLGAVLLDERHLFPLLVEEHLRPDHFFRDQHGAEYAAMLELHENNRKIDQLTVAETLRQQGKLEEVGGPEAIDGLAGWVPAAGNAREYGQIVREKAQMRALLSARSIAYSRTGASGVYMAKLVDRLGIADAIRSKTTFASTLDHITRR